MKTIIPGRKATRKYKNLNMTTGFNKEELEILNSIQNDEWSSVDKIEVEISDYRQIATEFLKRRNELI